MFILRPPSLSELTPMIFNMGFNSLRIGGLHKTQCFYLGALIKKFHSYQIHHLILGHLPEFGPILLLPVKMSQPLQAKMNWIWTVDNFPILILVRHV